MPTKRRRFGYLRRLASGRWQASYVGPDGLRRSAPRTFTNKTDADRWLGGVEADIASDRWLDPSAGRQTLGRFAEQWIDQRSALRPRTVDLYRWLARKYIAPGLGRVALADLSPAMIRSWRQQLIDAGASQSVCAKAYRLLRSILNTAVDDHAIVRNPCRIRGAGDERPAERPVLTVEQVVDLSNAVPSRYRALILVATFASLRWGEATALRRCDVDLEHCSVNVRAAFVERSNGSLELGPPKSRAGTRRIAIPGRIAEILAAHIDEYVSHDAEALIFAGPTGRPLRRSNFNKAAGWKRAAAGIGVPLLHFHDLRHTGNTFAASTPGASIRDLMERMGHDSMQAALIYQHRTRSADRRIAASMDDRIPAVIARGSHAVDLNQQRIVRRGHAGPSGPGFPTGAGDENRTRTVSLGS